MDDLLEKLFHIFYPREKMREAAIRNDIQDQIHGGTGVIRGEYAAAKNNIKNRKQVKK